MAAEDPSFWYATECFTEAIRNDEDRISLCYFGADHFAASHRR